MQRVVWFNGAFVPEAGVGLAIRDFGVIYGDAVFDTARTFGGRLFMAAEHVARLYRSLDAVLLPHPMPAADLLALTEELVDRNAPALRPGEDWWVSQRITSGLRALDGEPAEREGPTVMIECTPLPLRARARFFVQGIPAVIASRPRTPGQAVPSAAKTTNYLNMMLAQREVEQTHPNAWALLPDMSGDLAEGAGCNFFCVVDGTVLTPPEDVVLPGISRAVVIELCAELAIPCRVGPVARGVALAADEAFFTSTSLCLCPLASLNETRFPVPGPVTAQLMAAFARRVDFDYVGQYLAHLTEGPTSLGL
jgi:branched-chain amino acid aminotransferase